MALELENNGVKYVLEPRDHDLYGHGVDIFMLNVEGAKEPDEPIAFIPGEDDNAAQQLTQQWLKIAFPLELPTKGKKKK